MASVLFMSQQNRFTSYTFFSFRYSCNAAHPIVECAALGLYSAITKPATLPLPKSAMMRVRVIPSSSYILA